MKYRILSYICGAVAGSVGTYFVMRRRMEQKIEAEVEAFKKEYSEKHNVIGKIIEKEETEAGINFTAQINKDEVAERIVELNKKKKQDIMAARDISQRMNYNAFSKPPKEEDVDTGDEEYEDMVQDDHPKEGPAEKPYTITPDQFINDCPFYDKITLEYFEDGVLANALTEEIIEDIDGAIGFKSLEKFGEFEEDVVFVRNEQDSSDYEVILQHRPFVIFSEE